MGGKESKHHHHHQKSESPGAEAKTEAAATVSSTSPQPPAAAQSPPPEKVDVMILSTNLDKDLALAKLIKEKLEDSSIPVYIHCQESEAKLAGELIVDAKCIVYIASEDAANSNVGQDLISLAYISNKSISVVAETPKDVLLKSFVVGMRMTLYQTKWVIFEDPSTQLPDYISEVQGMVTPEPSTALTASIDQSSLIARRGGRLNTKLRAQTTIPDFGMGNQQQINSFWERNFPNDEEVPWYKFQKCFLDNYEAQLSKLLNEENIPWLLNMLKDDVFGGAEKITKANFMHVRGDSEESNAFWKVVSQIAVEKFNMKEVFNMNSSVRLAAIEKLAAFQNPAVIEALMTLLEDMDPNVRAVAAICLGRTGCTEERVVDKLIGLLKDGDRIVRQSACLSLGSMKAVKAIPHIGNIWRNDFISVVRNAARTALENMDIPEAKQVLSVTKVLEDEISALAGNQAAV